MVRGQKRYNCDCAHEIRSRTSNMKFGSVDRSRLGAGCPEERVWDATVRYLHDNQMPRMPQANRPAFVGVEPYPGIG